MTNVRENGDLCLRENEKTVSEGSFRNRAVVTSFVTVKVDRRLSKMPAWSVFILQTIPIKISATLIFLNHVFINFLVTIDKKKRSLIDPNKIVYFILKCR